MGKGRKSVMTERSEQDIENQWKEHKVLAEKRNRNGIDKKE